MPPGFDNFHVLTVAVQDACLHDPANPSLSFKILLVSRSTIENTVYSPKTLNKWQNAKEKINQSDLTRVFSLTIASILRKFYKNMG